MRNSLLRVIDDLETKLDAAEWTLDNEDISERSESILSGRRTMLVYTINQLRKVLEDHANTPNKRITANTE